MRKLRRLMYRNARRLGDLDALASGSPSRIARRGARKVIYRHAGRGLRRLLRLIGL